MESPQRLLSRRPQAQSAPAELARMAPPGMARGPGVAAAGDSSVEGHSKLYNGAHGGVTNVCGTLGKDTVCQCVPGSQGTPQVHRGVQGVR